MIFDTGQNGGKENVSMILIDYKDRRPLYEQIVEKLSDLMVRGILSRTVSFHPCGVCNGAVDESEYDPAGVRRAGTPGIYLFG